MGKKQVPKLRKTHTKRGKSKAANKQQKAIAKKSRLVLKASSQKTHESVSQGSTLDSSNASNSQKLVARKTQSQKESKRGKKVVKAQIMPSVKMQTRSNCNALVGALHKHPASVLL